MGGRVVLFTAQDIGFQLIERLARYPGIDLIVITYRTERDEANGHRSPIDACRNLGVRCIEATKVSPEVHHELAEFSPDIILGAYYSNIIPEAVLDMARVGAYNIHPGILPFYRGKYPTPWYILNGAPEFGMAIHEMRGGVDAGRVLVQRTYPMPQDITGAGLLKLTMDVGTDLLAENIGNLLRGELTPKPQAGVGSYYSSIDRRWQIDWNLSVEQIERRIRVHAKPYLPAFTYLLGRAVYINRATPISVDGYTAQGGGAILDVMADSRFVVTCANGCLMVEECDIYPALSDAERQIYLRLGNRFE
ncbi:MAG TPA: formyltransferase family protein [Terriglobia bacterium]|nr:formyltransferase family protein [Terriglobia bacterium]